MSYFLRNVSVALLVFLICAHTAYAQTQPTCTPPPSGLLDWWPGDDNANDIIGGNNGTLIGGVTFMPGEVGQAFSFDGLGAYVNVPANASFHPAAITVDLWLEANDLSDNPSIVSSNLTNDYDGYQLQIEPDGKAGFVIGGNAIRTYYTSTPGDIVTGQWYHIAVTYDGVGGVGSLKLYINGTQRSFSLNQTANFMEPSGPIYYSGDYPLNIGRRAGDGTLPFNGLVDELQVFNRALSATEIHAIYNAGSAGQCKLDCEHPKIGRVRPFAPFHGPDPQDPNHPGEHDGYTFHLEVVPANCPNLGGSKNVVEFSEPLSSRNACPGGQITKGDGSVIADDGVYNWYIEDLLAAPSGFMQSCTVTFSQHLLWRDETNPGNTADLTNKPNQQRLVVHINNSSSTVTATTFGVQAPATFYNTKP